MKSVIKWPLLLLAFIPLVVDSSVFFPYITGKSLMIRGLVSLAAILFFAYLAANKAYRDEITERAKKVFKNSIVISNLVFFLIYVVSAFFATDTFRAIFGNVERAEGLLGMIYFFGFFALSVLIFGKKDWITFFKLTLLTGAILFVHEIIQFFQGTSRPSSQTGNPIYLAAYFLFVIFSGIVVIDEAKRTNSVFWQVFSWTLMPISVLGMFITETRGVIIGLVAGIMVLLFYFLWKGKEISLLGKVSLKKASVVVLLLIVLFSGMFYLTRSANFWQKIPGFDRLAKLSANDATFETRKISFGVGLEAVRPDNNGLKKFLIGWGPENFSIAYNKYYDPHYYEFEQSWFDRSHNKLMDVFVMHGLLGLLAYLSIWIFFFFGVLWRKKISWENIGLLFFGTAYFTQNLFVFDSVSTFIPFFVMLGYAVYEFSFSDKSEETIPSKSAEKYSWTLVSLSGIVAAILAFCFAEFFMVPYFQMRGALDLWRSGSMDQVMQTSSYLTPYTYAQENIRTYFLNQMTRYVGKSETANNLFSQAVASMAELVEREPYSPRYFIVISNAYSLLAQAANKWDFFATAEEYNKKALELAPERQDVRLQSAFTLAQEGKFNDAIKIAKDTIALDPKVADAHYSLAVILSADSGNYKDVYNELETAFNNPGFTRAGQPSLIQEYEKVLSQSLANRDKDVLIGTARRLQQLVPDQKDQLNGIIDSAQKGTWSSIKLIGK